MESADRDVDARMQLPVSGDESPSSVDMHSDMHANRHVRGEEDAGRMDNEDTNDDIKPS